LDKLDFITVNENLKIFIHCNMKNDFKNIVSLDNNSVDCWFNNILDDDEYNDVFYPNTKFNNFSLTVELNG